MTRRRYKAKIFVRFIPHKEFCNPPVRLTAKWTPSYNPAFYAPAWQICPTRFHKPGPFVETAIYFWSITANAALVLERILPEVVYKGEPKA